MVFISGPAGAGKRTLAETAAKEFGFFNISVSDLIAQEITQNPKGSKTKIISDCVKTGKSIPVILPKSR